MLVKSTKKEDHISHLREAFGILRQYGMKLNPEKYAFGVTSRKFLGFLVSQHGIEVNPDQIKAIDAIPEVLTSKKQVQKLTGRIATLSRFISRSSDRSHKFFNVLRKDHGLQWNEDCVNALRKLKAYLSSPPLLVKADPGECLLVYLAVSEVAVSAVLVRENQDAKTRYPHLEKLALALVVASRKLRPREPPSRDFVADFSEEILPEAEQEALRASTLIDLWVLYTDGASNASGLGLGLVLEVPTGEIVRQSIRCAEMTNNEAEYEAVIAGLKLALKYGARRLILHCDSQLIVNQVTGTFQIKEQRLQKYQSKIHKLMPEFDECRLEQIPRAQNIEADDLAKLAAATKNLNKENMDGILPQDKKEAKKLRVQAARYNLINHDLYKRTFGGPLAKCLGPHQTRQVLEEVREGHCGAHTVRALVRCLIRASYYWPTMKKEAADYVRICEQCQKYAPMIHQARECLHSVTSPWPFIKWGMDIVDPLPAGR
ncbi:PREDICTED: uncharacterized protein LOC109236867 [Nicotiana attenuata]|uniref:uncharacterized protein LOC109236867 n=1 Tax=Nicotiana attenuata TaxID=49451 RepID=UPI000904785F|nr:PREDICTED: uncharacterized protein LOC109236867 [Nicotiana attenuata]